MKKIFFVLSLGLSFLFCLTDSQDVFAGASAYVTWVAPITDEGGGALTGLTGYRVYYDTSSHWASSCPTDVGNYININDGGTEEYFFNNNLIAGTTYYFTVVAYDGSGNLSTCGENGGGATEISLTPSYSGDIEGNDQDVDIFDYNILKTNYGTSNAVANINRSGLVDIFDYTILKGDYGSSF